MQNSNRLTDRRQAFGCQMVEGRRQRGGSNWGEGLEEAN